MRRRNQAGINSGSDQAVEDLVLGVALAWWETIIKYTEFVTILWVSLQIASFLNLGRKSESPAFTVWKALPPTPEGVVGFAGASNFEMTKCANEEPTTQHIAQKCTYINRINIPSEVAFSTDLGKSACSVCDCGSKKTLCRYKLPGSLGPTAAWRADHSLNSAVLQRCTSLHPCTHRWLRPLNCLSLLDPRPPMDHPGTQLQALGLFASC